MPSLSHDPATESEKGNGKPRLACVNVRHPPSKKSYGCTVLDMPESKEMTEQIDWQATQPSQAVYVSEYLKC